mmetsp:Transcript_3609/g.13790  ORF Transcript_3609/g.13790 Transcript_3609/m.13790 type:complete len:571 (-) Transcript_3609:102-1814(-)
MMNPAMMGGGQGGPRQVYVLNRGTKRESGRKAQLSNIKAGTVVSDIIRTTLGPRSMLKMILDMMGQIQLTSDGNAILREIDVSHPAARSMIDLARTQDEEVGDGTTSVIIMAGEMLAVAEPYVQRNLHPTHIVKGYFTALDDAVQIIDQELAFPIDLKDEEAVKTIVNSCIGTKFTHRYADLMCRLAVDAVQTVKSEQQNGKLDIDVKRYAKIEKIPGGSFSDCKVLDGVMMNKDILHPKMRRRIENPRILLLDCPVEYKKGESMTNTTLSGEEDFEQLLKLEEDWIKSVCDDIIKFKPDLVVTEKGLSDLAQYYLVSNGISALRRIRKTDNNRIARATGATIVHRTSEIQEKDIGTCGLFEVRKIGDEYFSFIEQCKDPKACSIVLRGGSKDILNEIERNLHDAMAVVKNLFIDPRYICGGGATEMALSQRLMEKSKSLEGLEKLPYQAVAAALEIIPKTLADNCGARTIRVITELRAKHAGGENKSWGVNGMTGELSDMRDLKIFEPCSVKSQTIKTAIESACMLLRIDDIVSGISKKRDTKKGSTPFSGRPGHLGALGGGQQVNMMG